MGYWDILRAYFFLDEGNEMTFRGKTNETKLNETDFFLFLLSFVSAFYLDRGRLENHGISLRVFRDIFSLSLRSSVQTFKTYISRERLRDPLSSVLPFLDFDGKDPYSLVRRIL